MTEQTPSHGTNGDRALEPGDFELLRRLATGEPLPAPEQDGHLTPFAREVVAIYRQANGHADDATLDFALRQVLGPARAAATTRALMANELPAPDAAPHLRFRALSLAELRTRPKPSYTVDRLLQADSVAVLEGVDGTYKSFLALAWAHCVALGCSWLGRPVKQGRVLYLLGEGSRGLPKRADAWQIENLRERQDLSNVLGFVVDEMPQLWKGDATEVLAANPGEFALVVVDTLARAMVGGNENLQVDMGQLVAGCEELRRGTGGATVLILHHLNGTGNTRGSTALPGAISTRLRLERQGNSRVVTLQTKKQRDDEPEPSITLVARTVELGTVDDQNRPETSVVLDLVDSPADSASGPSSGPHLTPNDRKALEVLSSLGEVGFAAWRDASGLSESSLKDARRNLEAHELAERLAGGRSRVTPAGEAEGRKGTKQGRFVLSPPGDKGGPEGAGESFKDSGLRPPAPAPCGNPGRDLPW